MTVPGTGSFVTRFATADIAERDRIPAWRDYRGRQLFGTDVEQATDDPFDGEVCIRAFPGIHLISSRLSPVRLIRSSALTVDGNDCLGLVTSSCGIGTVQRGSELSLGAGDATFLSSSDPSILESCEDGHLCCILIERRMLAPFVRDPEAALQRVIPANDTILRLLLGYLQLVADDENQTMGAGLADVLSSHIRDLIAHMLAHAADERMMDGGLRAARLARIKRYVTGHCGDPSMTVHDLAARFGTTPRYLQRLFELDGTTFTAFLLDQRLANVCRTLSSATERHKTVSEAAWAAGFSDISYFNRCFKRRYGVSPTEFRRQRR